MDQPLLFLTSTTSITPTGRNARSHARHESAKLTVPAKEHRGQFSSFTLNTRLRIDDQDISFRPAKRHKGCHSSKRKPTGYASQVIRSSQTLPIQLTKLIEVDDQTNLADLLAVATFHIRRISTRIAYFEPCRLIDALRCRQWSHAGYAANLLQPTPELRSAIACVTAKVQEIIGGDVSPGLALSEYTKALNGLQEALKFPELCAESELLATTQLLAIYEMLGLPDNKAWTKHLEGATALAQLQFFQTSNRLNEFRSQASPIFVEALLSNPPTTLPNHLWPSVVSELKTTNLLPKTNNDLLNALTNAASLLSTSRRPPPTQHSTDLLDLAHAARTALTTQILTHEPLFQTSTEDTKNLDFLGLCLALVIALDRLIISLRPKGSGRAVKDLEQDTAELCAQLMQMDLRSADMRPRRELVGLFRRRKG